MIIRRHQKIKTDQKNPIKNRRHLRQIVATSLIKIRNEVENLDVARLKVLTVMTNRDIAVPIVDVEHPN